MKTVFACPRCNQPGLIPEGLEAEQLVHCPACGMDFSAGEARLLEGEVPGIPECEFVPVARPLESVQSEAPGRGYEQGDLAWASCSPSPPTTIPEASEAVLASELSPSEASTTQGCEGDSQGTGGAAEYSSEVTPEVFGGEEGWATDVAGPPTKIGVEEACHPVTSTQEASVGTLAPEVPETAAEGQFPAEASQTTEGTPTAAVPTFTLELVCPHCQGVFSLGEAQLASTGETIPAELVRAIEEQLSGRSSQPEGYPSGEWSAAATVPVSTVSIQVPEEETRARPFARQPRKKVNVLKELVSWVGGAVLGLLIAYYLLVLIRGDHGNFLKIPLPGVRSTYKYSPSWFPSFMKPSPPGDKDSEKDSESEANSS